MPREVKQFVQCHIKTEAKDRPISEKQRSPDTLPQITESSAITTIPTQLESPFFQKLGEVANDLHLPLHLDVLLFSTFPWHADL